MEDKQYYESKQYEDMPKGYEALEGIGAETEEDYARLRKEKDKNGKTLEEKKVEEGMNVAEKRQETRDKNIANLEPKGIMKNATPKEVKPHITNAPTFEEWLKKELGHSYEGNHIKNKNGRDLGQVWIDEKTKEYKSNNKGKELLKEYRDYLNYNNLNAPRLEEEKDEEGKPVQVQTNTDTKEPAFVPDVKPYKGDKTKGERTTTGNYLEKDGDWNADTEINRHQIKDIYDVDVPKKEKEEVKGETETTSTEPDTETVTETTKETPSEEPKPTEETETPAAPTDNEKVKKAVDYLMTSIWNDYKNGYFGEVGSDVAKRTRNDLIVNEVGSWLYNVGAILRNEKREQSEYERMREQHNKNYEERFSIPLKQRKENEAENIKFIGTINNYIEASDMYKSLSDEERKSFVDFKNFMLGDVNLIDNAYRTTSPKLRNNFNESIYKQDYQKGLSSVLSNNKIVEEINNLKANKILTDEQASKVMVEAINLAIEGKYIGAEKEAGIKKILSEVGLTDAKATKLKVETVTNLIEDSLGIINGVLDTGSKVAKLFPTP